MIIFFHKETGEIFGTVNGRIHTPEEVKKLLVKPKDLPAELVGVFVVPMKPDMAEVKKPIYEMRFDKDHNLVNKIIGHKKRKVQVGLTPDTGFNDLILDFETGKKSLADYRVQTDENGVVENIVWVERTVEPKPVVEPKKPRLSPCEEMYANLLEEIAKLKSQIKNQKWTYKKENKKWTLNLTN